MKRANGMIYTPHKKAKIKLVKCNKCGKDLTPMEACYYVDGNNWAITHTAPAYCLQCYRETYKK